MPARECSDGSGASVASGVSAGSGTDQTRIFARLFQGSVKVEHLKGPVGIAHLGVVVADQGFVWLLFFMGLISVNLAVINFLPIPIADGGHMVFLIYEKIRGKQAPESVRVAATYAGLLMLASLMIFVIYLDIRRFIFP